MLEVMIGAVLGTIASLAIAHFYYSRSTRDLKAEVDGLRQQLVAMRTTTLELQEAADIIQGAVDVTRRHVVAGTPDDPEYPYK